MKLVELNSIGRLVCKGYLCQGLKEQGTRDLKRLDLFYRDKVLSYSPSYVRIGKNAQDSTSFKTRKYQSISVIFSSVIVFFFTCSSYFGTMVHVFPTLQSSSIFPYSAFFLSSSCNVQFSYIDFIFSTNLDNFALVCFFPLNKYI